ncbi:hypothetical protein QUA79_00505 [Microcoleus sp. F8-D1]
MIIKANCRLIDLGVLATMLSLYIKALSTIFPVTVLLLLLSSNAERTNHSQEPKNLSDLTVLQTNISHREQKQNLVVAAVNSEKEAVKAVLTLHFKALTEKNLTVLMDTIHPKSPYFAYIKTSQQQLFAKVDIKHELKKIDVVSLSNNKAIVRVAQTSTVIRVRDEGFYGSSQAVGLYTFLKYQGKWKMFDYQIEEFKSL